ncbi:hypothetical protein SQ11_15965, partial [Nitrosospira sp. NpAV]
LNYNFQFFFFFCGPQMKGERQNKGTSKTSGNIYLPTAGYLVSSESSICYNKYNYILSRDEY